MMCRLLSFRSAGRQMLSYIFICKSKLKCFHAGYFYLAFHVFSSFNYSWDITEDSPVCFCFYRACMCALKLKKEVPAKRKAKT